MVSCFAPVPSGRERPSARIVRYMEGYARDITAQKSRGVSKHGYLSVKTLTLALLVDGEEKLMALGEYPMVNPERQAIHRYSEAEGLDR